MELNETKRFLIEVGRNASLRRELVSCATTSEMAEIIFNKGFSVNGEGLDLALCAGSSGNDDDLLLNKSANWLLGVLNTFR
jgi:hypothetical protein